MGFYWIIMFVFGIAGLSAICYLFILLFNSQIKIVNGWFRTFEVIALFLGPAIFLSSFDTGDINDCCSDFVVFSPHHRLTIYTIIFLCLTAYFFSTYRRSLYPPLLELIINCLLLVAVILNIFIIIQIKDPIIWILGNVSIIGFYLIQLLQNHRLLRREEVVNAFPGNSIAGRISMKLLQSSALIKYPVLLFFCLPILVLIAAVLYLFGQKPDSVIRAFTDTYHQGLSQLDYMCDNVQCGGHYLCSVAANGHPAVVKPVRLGKRNGGTIICNRQLLISNAFEELLQERLPRAHQFIRMKYDRVGDAVHKYYAIFNNKFVSDVVYFLMKPAEWIFLAILYLSDRNPENRIAQQYLLQQERIIIRSN